jgi:uncharacterized protein (DUF1800 family)
VGSPSARSDIALLGRRAGFGLTPSELEAASAAGYGATVDALVGGLTDPAATSPSPPVLSAGPPPGPAADLAARHSHDRAVAADVATLQDWWVGRMLSTPSPLTEKLALYWHGHFATGVTKVRDARLMYLQNQLFRSIGAGGFEALTQAVAKDGAMMVWLDTSTDKAAHPNENFAREMMELFTLGIGNYTQDDVVAAAEGFTGWTYDRAAYRHRFQPGQHSYATKTYLGHEGDWNGNDIVRLAVTDPDSGRFVVARVWSHFAYPVATSDPVVTDLLPSYTSVGDLLEAVFTHPAFTGPSARTGLVKQPIEWLVGAARLLGLDPGGTGSGDPAPGGGQAGGPASGGAGGPTRGGRRLAALSGALGQVLFDPPNVGGWGQNTYWLDTATAALRLRISLEMAERADLSAVADVAPAGRVDAVAELLALDGWGPTTAGALQQAGGDPTSLVALGLSSPEFVLA